MARRTPFSLSLPAKAFAPDSGPLTPMLDQLFLGQRGVPSAASSAASASGAILNFDGISLVSVMC
jgi:hypothetical protein